MAFNIYDFTTLTKSIHEGLSSQFSPTATLAIEWTIVGLAYLLFVALFGLFLVYAERNVCAGLVPGVCFRPLQTSSNS